MEPAGFLPIAILTICGLAVLLIVTTIAAHGRAGEASLDRKARRVDRSTAGVPARRDLDEEAHRRFEPVERSLNPVATPPVSPGPLIRFGESPADPEEVGLTRRRFFNRAVVATQGLVLSSFGLAVIGFLWPSQTGGFGAKIKAGKLEDILGEIRETNEPFYVPEARTYVNPYPESALAGAQEAYPESVLPGMKAGVVALFQKCPHLGCRVPWCKTSQWFECPCHGSKYNRVGEKKGGPAPRGMDRFPLEVTGGQVMINTGTVVQGPPIGTNTTGQEAEGPNCV